jgi:hypothetical protein
MRALARPAQKGYERAVPSFEWLEGSRTFSIVLGTILSGSCLALAIPILWWFLPSKRRRIFSEKADPRLLLQLFYGLACMAMAFTNALCRYIPHRPLGLTHPVFFFTTIALVLILEARVVSVALGRTIAWIPASRVALTTVLVVLVAVPVGTTIEAFLT